MTRTVGLLIPNSLKATTIVSLAQMAEGFGFDEFWVPDERFYRDVYSVLAVCAINTSRICIGPCVTDPYSRHPALTAAAIATLDEVSNGRARLGIGAGISGFAEMGLTREKSALAIREAVILIERLHKGMEVTFEGSTVSFRKGKLGLTPLQRKIPIYVASNGPLGQRMGAEVADAVIMEACASVLEAKHFVQSVKAHALRAGREEGSVRCIARLNVAIGRTSASALEVMRVRAARTLASGRTKFATLHEQGIELPEEIRASVADVPYNAGPAPYERIKEAVTDDMVRGVALAGTGAEVLGQVTALLKAGVSGLILSPIPIQGEAIEEAVKVVAESVGTRLATL